MQAAIVIVVQIKQECRDPITLVRATLPVPLVAQSQRVVVQLDLLAQRVVEDLRRLELAIGMPVIAAMRSRTT